METTATTTSLPNANRPFRVLSLDGGGSKGVYTLGVLKEVEAIVKAPLCNVFDLVFGTSTGSIIAALIALGYVIPLQLWTDKGTKKRSIGIVWRSGFFLFQNADRHCLYESRL